VRVDRDLAGGNFSSPAITANGRVYFMVQRDNGLVMVTQSSPPPSGAGSVQAVPALGNLGLLALGGVLAGAAWRRRRRH
jgi:hypothetical protein